MAHRAGEGAPHGTLVVADYQTAGKGRLGRQWFAPKGTCLLFSLLLRPRCEPQQLGLINHLTAIAVCRSFSNLGIHARIKWPNDVLIEGRKVAGILSETPSLQTRQAEQAVVVGVGVNVNVTEFPAEIASAATSLALETGGQIDRLEVLASFLQIFGDLYRSFPGTVLPEYTRLCDTVGKQVRVQLAGRTLVERATGLDPSGGLVLESGEVISAGDVLHVE